MEKKKIIDYNSKASKSKWNVDSWTETSTNMNSLNGLLNLASGGSLIEARYLHIRRSDWTAFSGLKECYERIGSIKFWNVIDCSLCGKHSAKHFPGGINYLKYSGGKDRNKVTLKINVR